MTGGKSSRCSISKTTLFSLASLPDQCAIDCDCVTNSVRRDALFPNKSMALRWRESFHSKRPKHDLGYGLVKTAFSPKKGVY